jgi:hypothetical protein
MMQPGIAERACRDYARHVAHVNADAWKTQQAPSARTSLRARVAAVLIALGTRLAPAAARGIDRHEGTASDATRQASSTSA